ncbi:MAG: tRNA epoxyqueuosine(34) reductase QueG [Bacteroidetes bacterium]|nr:tRNA epoxyqueuosine(34) reductase QueG [Bacteroidota bacterium]
MKEQIRQQAINLGFSVCGFASAAPLDNLKKFYDGFLGEHRQAAMGYLERYAAQRLDPSLLLSGVKTVIAVLMNYYPPRLIPEEDNFILSKYAPAKRYPPFIKRRLEPLARFIATTGMDIRSKIYVDSGPVLEKAWAQRCGVGWQGKHTILINPKAGSYFYIGIILTTLDLEPDPAETDHCGSCSRCMDACPTGAIDRPYQLDISRCITYCTSVKNAVMPGEVLRNLKGRIYGCDICQDVCPYNRFATPTLETHFHPHEALFKMRRKDWLDLSREQFDLIFAGTSVEEKGYEHLMRNIMNVSLITSSLPTDSCPPPVPQGSAPGQQPS